MLPFAWLGGDGVEVDGGASWRVGEACGGRWPWWCSSAAAGVFGGATRRAEEGKGSRGERGEV